MGFQIGYGFYEDNGSYGKNAQAAVANNEYELAGAATGTAVGAGIGVWFGGVGAVPGALAGMGIGYGVGALVHGADALVQYIYSPSQAQALFNSAQPLNTTIAPIGDFNAVWIDMGGAAALNNVPAFALTGGTSMTPFTPFTVGADAFSNLTTPTLSGPYQTDGGSLSNTLAGVPDQVYLAEYPSISYYTPTSLGQDMPYGYVSVDASNFGPPQPLYQPAAKAS